MQNRLHNTMQINTQEFDKHTIVTIKMYSKQYSNHKHQYWLNWFNHFS